MTLAAFTIHPLEGQEQWQRSMQESIQKFEAAKKRWVARKNSKKFDHDDDEKERAFSKSAWKPVLEASFARFDAALQRLETCGHGCGPFHEAAVRRAWIGAERERMHLLMYRRFVTDKVRRDGQQSVFAPSWYIDRMWREGMVGL